MKKIICLLLAMTMLFSLCACGTKTETQEPADTAAPTEEPAESAEPSAQPEASAEPSAQPEAASEPEKVSAESGTTVADALVKQFRQLVSNKDASSESILGEMAVNEILGSCMVVEEQQPGYLPGFTEDISGFESCYKLAPEIGSIPFVAYLFDLSSDADAVSFEKTLTELHDLNWNICTSADQMATAVDGSRVFFVMAPESFEEDMDEGIELFDDAEPLVR